MFITHCRRCGRNRARSASHEAVHDPDPASPANAALGTWVLRVSWLEKLTHTYCFEVPLRDSNGTPVGVVDNVALFHGNLARVHHPGRAFTIVHQSDFVLFRIHAPPPHVKSEAPREEVNNVSASLASTWPSEGKR